MILSDTELKVTREQMQMLIDSLDAPPRNDLPTELIKAGLGQTRKLITELQAQVDEYERYTSVDPGDIPVNTVDDLLVAPIRYRLARRLTVEAFAKLVGVSVRQIFRYEREGYRNCSVTNLTRILDHLKLRLEGRITAGE